MKNLTKLSFLVSKRILGFGCCKVESKADFNWTRSKELAPHNSKTENYVSLSLVGTVGGAQWSETHSDPPKNPKNCVAVPKFTSTES